MNEYRREEIGGLALVGRMVAQEGKRDELLHLLEEAVALCGEHEPNGALTAAFHTSPANPDLVVLYEHYPSRASLEEHRANYERIPAYGEMRSRMSELLAAPIEIVEAVNPVVRFSLEATRDARREVNLQLVRRMYEAENAHDLNAYAACLAPDVEVWVNGRLTQTSREGWLEASAATPEAFPDWRHETLSLTADGDVVHLRWRCTGTHTASWAGVPASGRRIEFSGATSLEVREGLVQRIWLEMDLAGPLRQMRGT